MASAPSRGWAWTALLPVLAHWATDALRAGPARWQRRAWCHYKLISSQCWRTGLPSDALRAGPARWQL